MSERNWESETAEVTFLEFDAAVRSTVSKAHSAIIAENESLRAELSALRAAQPLTRDCDCLCHEQEGQCHPI